jgi:hypothetical protein
MVLIAMVFGITGVLIVRRFIEHSKLKSHHDIAGPLFATLGVIYAVLLGFTTVIVWQQYDDANTTLTREANYYADIYRDMGGLSPEFRSKAEEAMDAYINAVINDEWKVIGYGQRSEKVQEMAAKVWELYSNYEPQTETQKIFLSESVRKMNEAGEMRRQRLMDSTTGLNPVLWMVLIVGGCITISFTFFFGSDNIILQLIMTTLLSALIGLLLFTILAMDYPYSGDLSVKPDALIQILAHIKN